jgi:hypothetical protein
MEKGIETAMKSPQRNCNDESPADHISIFTFLPLLFRYGFFVQGTWPGQFDFCKSDPSAVKIYFEGPEISFIWYLGTPMEIV